MLFRSGYPFRVYGANFTDTADPSFDTASGYKSYYFSFITDSADEGPDPTARAIMAAPRRSGKGGSVCFYRTSDMGTVYQADAEALQPPANRGPGKPVPFYPWIAPCRNPDPRVWSEASR